MNSLNLFYCSTEWNHSHFFVGGACPGICVDDEIAVVCGHITDGDALCEIGTKCCVPTHSYPNEVHNKFFAAKNNN